MSKIDQLKKMYSAMAIEKKDISLQDLVNQKGKDGVIEVEIVGLASKLVPKYQNATNDGYHTMVYLKDGKKTGGFSNALHQFANFFYEGAGLDTEAAFNRVNFNEKSFIKARISIVKFTDVMDGKTVNKTTYNFELLDGDVEKVERIAQFSGNTPLLIEGVDQEPGEITA